MKWFKVTDASGQPILLSEHGIESIAPEKAEPGKKETPESRRKVTIRSTSGVWYDATVVMADLKKMYDSAYNAKRPKAFEHFTDDAPRIDNHED